MSSKTCFIAGTLIAIDGGYRPIEEIKADDIVWAMNERTGENALKRVVQTFERVSDKLLHVFTGGEEIVTTPEHPFFVQGKGWTAARELQADIR